MSIFKNPDKAKQQLREGVCPFCEKSGFKMVGTHVKKIHGFKINDIKDELLLSRSEGFIDPELKDIHSENAKKNGLGMKYRHSTKGAKHSELSRKKLSPHWHSQEIKDRFIKNTHNHAVRKKLVDSGQHAKASEKSRIAQFGTVEGYDDSFYLDLAQKFVEEVKKMKAELGYTKGIFIRLSQRMGRPRSRLQRQVYRAAERGFLKMSTIGRHPDGELTEKAHSMDQAKEEQK